MNRKRILIPDKKFAPLQRDHVTGYWWVRTTHNNQRLYRSTGEKQSRYRAYVIAKQLIADFLGTDQPQEEVTFKNVWDVRLAEKKKKSFKTYQSFELHGRLHLLPRFGKKVLSTTHWEREWLSYVEDENAKVDEDGNPIDRQLEHDWRYFMEVMKRAFEQGYMKSRVRVENPDPEDGVGREYPDEELTRLRENATHDLRLQIEMAVTMGMRKGEILKCRWSWIDLHKGEIQIPAKATKTRRFRVVEINKAWVLPELKARYLAATGPFVFCSKDWYRRTQNVLKPQGSNETAWSRCKERAKVEGHFHWLRHTCATRMLRASGDLEKVALYLGMSMSTLRRIYWHMNKEDRVQLAEAVTLQNARTFVYTGRKRKDNLLKLQAS